MKNLFLILSASFPFFAFAGQNKALCEARAEKAVYASAEKNYYDKDGFDAYSCVQASNKAAVICEVAASKGSGDAIDTYRVVLNKNCNHVFRVELIGEE